MSLPKWQLDFFCLFVFGPLYVFFRTVRRRAWVELGRGASIHVSCDTSVGKSKRGSSFAPPRWGHLAEPWWIGVRQATPQRFMIKAYYVGKLTLIADLNCWNQLICQCWIESMVNSVCHSDRSDGKKPSKSGGLNEWCQLCLDVVKSYHWWLTADTKKEGDRRKKWDLKSKTRTPSHWSE